MIQHQKLKGDYPNPLRHLDPLGALMLLLVGFGWANPYKSIPNIFKQIDGKVCSRGISRPLMNLVLAYLSAVALRIFPPINILGLFYLLWYNAMLAVFNLIPLPPFGWFKSLIRHFLHVTYQFIIKLNLKWANYFNTTFSHRNLNQIFNP